MTMYLAMVAASSYSSGELVGKLLVVVLVAAGILHFWRTGPSKAELARKETSAPAGPSTATWSPEPNQAKGRPSWAAPVVWGIAVIVAIAVIASHEDPNAFSDSEKQEFVRGCTASSGAAAVNCQCLLDQLIAKGYDTDEEMREISAHVRDAAVTNSPASLPDDFVSAVRECGGQQPQSQ